MHLIKAVINRVNPCAVDGAPSAAPPMDVDSNHFCRRAGHRFSELFLSRICPHMASASLLTCAQMPLALSAPFNIVTIRVTLYIGTDWLRSAHDPDPTRSPEAVPPTASRCPDMSVAALRPPSRSSPILGTSRTNLASPRFKSGTPVILGDVSRPAPISATK